MAYPTKHDLVQHTVNGTRYSVEARVIDAAIVAFDVKRDGLGEFTGEMGRTAFLALTSDLVHRAIARAPIPSTPDEYRVQRHLRVVRSILAKRPRKAVSNVDFD